MSKPFVAYGDFEKTNKHLIDELRLTESTCKKLRRQLTFVSEALETLEREHQKHTGHGDEIDNQATYLQADLDVKRGYRVDVSTRIEAPRHCEENTISYANKIQTRKMQQQIAEKNTILPFVVGTSTNRSHNICSNLQHMLAQFNRHGFGNTEKNTLWDNKYKDAECDTLCSVKESCQANKIDSSNPELDGTKKFKDVLRTLYHDFNCMVKEYDNLLRVYDLKQGNTSIVEKKLACLEKNLHFKEDEIVMVISLNKEATIMKERVRLLKNASEGRMAPSHKTQKRGYPDSTQQRMKFLLRQINKLQECLQDVRYHNNFIN